MRVEFWFDFSCPYAYLASTKIAALCERHGATLDYQPMLLGGVFRAIGAGDGPMRTLSPQKAKHLHADLHRWASALAVPFVMPSSHPMRTVLALRTLLGLPKATWPKAIDAIYAAYWQASIDITVADNLRKVLQLAGVADEELANAITAADLPAAKDELHHRTAKAVEHGVFGAPAMLVYADDESTPPLLFWGQDRLAWVEAALQGWRPDQAGRARGATPSSVAAPSPHSGVSVDVFFDIASPFAYFGLHQIAALRDRTGATFVLRPILLGALFRDIGQVDVPLFGFPVPKQRYVSQEISRWANWLGVPFSFPTKFPQRTVTAQRLILLALADDAERGLALALRLGHLFWSQNGDLNEAAQLATCLSDCGLAPTLLEQCSSDAAKQGLINTTAAGRDAGVFGVPTWVVPRNQHAPLLFWGQDRVDFVERALAGWAPTIPGQP